jgi:hypothetical protein
MYKDEQSNIRLSGQRGFGVHTRTAASLDAVANIQDLILKEGEKIKITSSDEIYLSDKPDELQAGISFTTESGIKSLKKSVLKEFLTTLNENDKNILLHTNLLDNIYLELYSSLLSSNAFLTNLQDAYDKIIDLFNEYNKEDFTKTTEYDYLKAIDSTLQNKENKQNECGPGF